MTLWPIKSGLPTVPSTPAPGVPLLPDGRLIVMLPDVKLYGTAPACVKSDALPTTPVRNCGTSVVSVKFVTFVRLSPFTLTRLGEPTTTAAGTPKTSSGPHSCAAGPVEVTWLIITEADRPFKFGFVPSVPPNNGVPATVLPFSTKPCESSPNDRY